MKVLLSCACIAAVLFLAELPASAEEPVCDESVRVSFVDAVDSGATADDLEMMFGYCRDDGSTKRFDKLMIITNTGSTGYERMNSCGYHPQNETVFCDVELRRRGGYGGFPNGSLEYVLFCLDCNRDGFYDFQAVGSVHVTNDISGGPLSFFFNASASTVSAPPACTANDGMNTDVRAILSWARMPGSCFFVPIWGHQIDFTARRDP